MKFHFVDTMTVTIIRLVLRRIFIRLNGPFLHLRGADLFAESSEFLGEFCGIAVGDYFFQREVCFEWIEVLNQRRLVGYLVRSELCDRRTNRHR